MYSIDLSSLGGILDSLLLIAGGVMRLDPLAFQVAFSQPGGGFLALGILLLAGLSVQVGQIVVLYANHIKRNRILVSVLMGTMSLLFSGLIWTWTSWLVANFLLGAGLAFTAVGTVVALSSAPLLFGFFVLIPYIGTTIFYLLRIWTFLAFLIGLRAIFDFSFTEALLAASLGWLLLEFIFRVPVLQVGRLRSWYWRLRTGKDARLPQEALMERFLAENRAINRQKTDDQG